MDPQRPPLRARDLYFGSIVILALIFAVFTSGSERALYLIGFAFLLLYKSDRAALSQAQNSVQTEINLLTEKTSAQAKEVDKRLHLIYDRVLFLEKLKSSNNKYDSELLPVQTALPEQHSRSLWPAVCVFVLLLFGTNYLIYAALKEQLLVQESNYKVVHLGLAQHAMQFDQIRDNLELNKNQSSRALQAAEAVSARIEHEMNTIYYNAWATNCTKNVSQAAPLACWNFQAQETGLQKVQSKRPTLNRSMMQNVNFKVEKPITEKVADISTPETISTSPNSETITQPRAQFSDAKWTQQNAKPVTKKPWRRLYEE